MVPLFCGMRNGGMNDNKGLIINYGEGGYKMGKSRVQNFLRPPPPQDRVKLFVPPPFLMANTSSYCLTTMAKLFVSPLHHG